MWKETSLFSSRVLASCYLFQEQKKHLVLFKKTKKLSKKKKKIRCTSECLLRNSPDTRCLLLDIASVWLCVSSGMLLPFGAALKEVIKTLLFHLLRPQRSLLLRRWFPLQRLHSLVSLTLTHTFFTPYLRINTHMLHCCPQIVNKSRAHTLLFFFLFFFLHPNLVFAQSSQKVKGGIR